MPECFKVVCIRARRYTSALLFKIRLSTHVQWSN